MSISGHAILKATILIAIALTGAALMITVDGGGTVWLKFALYSLFFVAVFLGAVLSPLQSCGLRFFRRQTKG